MKYEQIRYEVDGPTLLLTMDRPDHLNAFTGVMLGEMVDALHRADADLGRGPSTFDRSAQGETKAEEHRDGGGLLTLEIFKLKKPVIAAINGPAVGVGVTMTLPMDIRIASTQARLGFVFSRRGIVPEACSTYFLPRVVTPSQAAEWLYTGRVFDAQEALRGGLVSRVVEPAELLPAARAIAKEIADNTAPVSVALCRQMLWRSLGWSHPMDAHRVDSLGIYWMGQTEDVKEGVASFLEKRKPNFKGRPSTDMPPYYPWWEEAEF